ncbi:amidohydrolase [Rhizodiscina lignyota]|uniref:Amidohydrolase n=1 Tax=Rhizodiscina lignyota TaxID=1504668 RepID=A0A9P4M4J7_9PEZI|nr:amidohydrolase [Rhizodiscina lignyota]
MASQTQPAILLRGGTLLIHDDDNHVIPTHDDLLIEGSTIAKIGKDIQPPSGAKVIDCTGKIGSPGFISTHHHLFQTQLKGRHANHTLVPYLAPGSFIASLYTLEDTFWGELSGALEAIDAGTTTVVDHTCVNNSPDYSRTAVQALITSGLRCIYCYCPPRTVSNWSPFTFGDDFQCSWMMENFKTLAAQGPYGNGRVEIGFAHDGGFLPPEALISLHETVRAAPAKLITSHAVGGAMRGYAPSAIQALDKHGVLGPDYVLSHADFPKEGDAEKLAKSGASVSTTTNTELQMGWPPVALEAEFYDHASLGIDCHSWGSASIVTQMNQLLQWKRCDRGKELDKEGKWGRSVGPSVEQVFNLGTIGGAKAVGIPDQIGKLKAGMKADILIFDGTSPAMLAAAEEDPVAAIVLHSSVRDIGSVIVDGVIRKEGGKMLDIIVADAFEEQQEVVKPGTSLSWKDVVQGVLESRTSLDGKVKNIDMRDAEEKIITGFHFNREGMVDYND